MEVRLRAASGTLSIIFLSGSLEAANLCNVDYSV